MNKLSVVGFLVLSTLSSVAQWTGIDYSGNRNYKPFSVAPLQEGEIAEFAFPPANQHAHFPALLVYAQSAPVDLRGTTITCQIQITATNGSQFVFGGQNVWNFGTLPPHTRLFFSTVTGYDNQGLATNYWFNNTSHVVITNNTGVATLTAKLDHWGDWSDGQGGNLSNAFWNAAGNAVQIGICFGGGSFYDIGVAMQSGNATLRLISFTVNPAFRLRIAPLNVNSAEVSVVGGFEGSAYCIERSNDLLIWNTAGFIEGTNVLTVSPGYYRGRVLQ